MHRTFAPLAPLASLALVALAVAASPLAAQMPQGRTVRIQTWDRGLVEVEPKLNFAPDQATLTVQRIMSPTGLLPNFVIVTKANYGNASAGIGDDGRRYIVYDPAFLDGFADGAANWGATSIFAHEIGHHLQGHTALGRGSYPAIELEADDFSGWAMARLGASLADAQAVMAKLAPEEDGSTHPGRAKRLAAIAKGWTRGRTGAVVATSAPSTPAMPKPEEAARLAGAYAAIDAMVAAMKGASPQGVRAVFDPAARVALIQHGVGGARDTTRLSFDELLAEADGSFDERTIKREGTVEGDRAKVINYYNFYLESGKRSHCGAELWELRRTAAGWRIVSLEDHQMQTDCPATP